jgi:iron-sulfur cluster assembly accessory protein
MVTITDAAVTALNDVLEEQNKKDHYLRVFIAGMGCGGPSFGLALEEKAGENDKSVEISTIKLIYDAELEDVAENLVVDYIDSEMGTGFVIENTAAVHCGTSGCGRH